MPKPYIPTSRRDRTSRLLTLEAVVARQEPINTRDRLADFWNTRITVQAVFQRFGYTRHSRKVAVVEHITHEGELVADHVWIPFGKALKALHLKTGNLIQFEARVMRYVKNRPDVFFYGLDDIAAPIVLRRK